jgi:chaperonin GroEL
MPVIEKEIDAQTRQISIAEVENVASVAGKSKEKGRILREIYEQIGIDGIIYPQGNFSFDGVTKYAITEGIKFKNTGFLSDSMVHDEEAVKLNEKPKKAIYFNPTILVTKRKINTINEIEPLLKTLTEQNKKDLVIFTDDMDSGVASMLIAAHKNKVLNCLIIKAPTVYKNSVFQDFAKCTGATIVEDGTGITFKNLPLSALGTCGVLITDAEETKIIGTQDISDHIAELKTKTDVESQLRVCLLTAKTAVLEIGAMSETDLSYHRLKYEDAIGSSYRALNSGIVMGGGIALLNVANKLPDTVGGRILKKALTKPFEQLCENSLIVPDYDKIGGEMGYDLVLGEIVNMFEKGLVDSAQVVKNEVKNAVGIASTAITTPYLITLPVKTPEQIAFEMMQNKGMRM